MKSQLQITFRNMEPSEEICEWIRAGAEKLETFYGRVFSCRVAVERPHRHRANGAPYHVRIDLKVPRGEIVVKREASLMTQASRLREEKNTKCAEVKLTHKDLRATLNEAFKSAGRRLQDYARRQRGDIKTRSPLERRESVRIGR